MFTLKTSGLQLLRSYLVLLAREQSLACTRFYLRQFLPDPERIISGQTQPDHSPNRKNISYLGVNVVLKTMEKRMRKTVLGITFILLSMGIGSCGLIGGEEPEAEQSSDAPAEQSFPSASPELPSPPAAKVVLTRPTNPDERLRVVKSGRSDPFAEIVPTVIPDNSSPRTIPTNSNPRPSSPSTVKVSKPSNGSNPAKPSSSSPSTKPNTAKPGKIVLPTLPKPEVAQGVKVTGVLNLGGRPKAILKAPGEKSTRTVGVGERIANGQVLVKSIILNPAAPVVVLEQSGMEVRVGVGQDPIALASADKDNAKK